MDMWVLEVQRWVNSTYGGVSGYIAVEEDGRPTWATMWALTRGLQVELGITALSNNFGATTYSELSRQYGTLSSATPVSNVVRIYQGALWVKGYWGGVLDGVFGPTVSGETVRMKQNMGLGDQPTVHPKVFKAALTMDAYTLLSGGAESIRSVQQWLNGTYWGRRDFYVIPCDGLFTRDVQRALLYAIQYEIGMADGTANGNFGPGTKDGLKTYGNVGIGSVDSTRRMVRLFQAALRFNRYNPPFSGTFDTTTRSETLAFQDFVELPQTGRSDYQTWCSHLVSTGDPDRPGTASDARTPIDAAKAAALYANGYRTIGRYLTVETKRYQPGELDVIFGAGLKTFPVFQEMNNSSGYFDYGQGKRQGTLAVRRARQLGMKAGATIYFSVDYDPTGDEIIAKVLPFFEGVRDGVSTSRTVEYQVGVYGTRNVCSQVSAAGLAASSFVAGMSTGWSGNLGFQLPENWAYDQIQTIWIGSGDGLIQIDKNVQSDRARPLTSADVLPTPVIIESGVKKFDSFYHGIEQMRHEAEAAAMEAGGDMLLPYCDNFVFHYLQTPTYWPGGDPDSWFDELFLLYTPLPEATPGMSEYMISRISMARALFEGNTTVDRRSLAATYGGQLDHFAATTRGYFQWGFHGVKSECGIGDLGRWALDLATFWADWVEKGAGMTLTKWIDDFLFVDLPDEQDPPFTRKDMVADVDGFLVASLAAEGRTAADAVREIRLQDQPWRYSEFLMRRFGLDREVCRQAVRHMFTTGVTEFWIDTPVWFALKDARDPTPLEIEELAEAFTSRLFERANVQRTPSAGAN